MNEYYNLFLPLSKREVKIEISIPRYKENLLFDTLYLLDGQNAFQMPELHLVDQLELLSI